MNVRNRTRGPPGSRQLEPGDRPHRSGSLQTETTSASIATSAPAERPPRSTLGDAVKLISPTVISENNNNKSYQRGEIQGLFKFKVFVESILVGEIIVKSP